MRNINRVMLTGNLTRDAELRRTQSGTPVLCICVAVNESRRNQSGEWEECPNFVECSMFGDKSEKLVGSMTKGTKVAVDGHLRYSKWQDKRTGENRSKLDVIMESVEFMSRKEEKPRQEAGYYPDDVPF